MHIITSGHKHLGICRQQYCVSHTRKLQTFDTVVFADCLRGLHAGLWQKPGIDGLCYTPGVNVSDLIGLK